MSNTAIGNKCEEYVVKVLRENHYWVYHIPHKTNGQPVDIFAARGTDSSFWLIDAKHVAKDDISFSLSRIEPNQWSTMRYAREWADIQNLGFAILFERTNMLHWLSYDTAYTLYKDDKKSINMRELQSFEEIIK